MIIRRRWVSAALLALGTSAAAVIAADTPPTLPLEPAPVVRPEQPPEHIIKIEIGFEPWPLDEPDVTAPASTPMPTPPAVPQSPANTPTSVPPPMPRAPSDAPTIATPPAPVVLPIAPTASPDKRTTTALTLAELEQMALGRPAPQKSAPTGPMLSLEPNKNVDVIGQSADVSKIQTCSFVDLDVPCATGPDGKRSVSMTPTQAQTLAQQYRMINGVRLRYYHLLALQKLIAVREDLASVSRDAVMAIEAMTNAGQATKAELLQARIEAREQTAALDTAKSVYDTVWHRMAALVGQPDMAVGTIAGDLEQCCTTPSFDGAWAHMLEANPELQAARSEVFIRQSNLRQSLAASGGRTSNSDKPAADGFINQAVAFFSGPVASHEPQVKQAAWTDLSRCEQNVGRLEQSLRQRLTGAYARYERSKQIADLYRSQNLPDAKEAFELSVISYRQGRGSWPQVQIAQRNYYRISTEYVETLADLRRSELVILGLLVDGSDEPPAASTAR